jgi:hypothetical protein
MGNYIVEKIFLFHLAIINLQGVDIKYMGIIQTWANVVYPESQKQ